MAQTGALVRRNASFTPASEYLEKVLAANPSAWGVTIVTPEGLMTNSAEYGATTELITTTLNDFKERDIYFHFVSADDGLDMDDVSPHILVQDPETEEKIIIAFADGEFTGYRKLDSAHPSCRFFVEECLAPKIETLWEMADGDLDKVWAAIEKPLFKKEVMTGVTEGAVTIIAKGGKAVTFAVGDKHAEYKWGWVSQNYGYAVAAAEEPKANAEPAKPKSMFPSKNKSTVREPVRPAAGSAVAEVKTDGASSVGNVFIRQERPKFTDSRKDRKIWLQRRIGYCPIGWEEKKNGQYPSINVYVDKTTNQMIPFSEIKKMFGIDAVGLPPLNNPPRAEGKNTEPDHVEGNERENGPAVTVDKLPVMSAKSREFAKDILRREDVKKLIAENGDVVSDPARIAEEEKKIVGYGQQLGSKTGLMDFATMCFLSFEEQQKWAAADPGSYNVFTRSLINYFLSVEAVKKSKLTAEEVHVVAKEELAPEKKSMFPSKKRAAA